MFKTSKKIIEKKLYNKIVNLSRNKLLYTEFALNDTFQNRINLIFIHVSFLFTKIKHDENVAHYKEFYQKMFDYTFNQIEINMREIGYGDVTVNKKMKLLVKSFYNILLHCDNYEKKTSKQKSSFICNYLTLNNDKNSELSSKLIAYFDKYYIFCLDLSYDRVLMGDLNFNYK
jgi:cytochrome b pre-mRNA-processing protein 3